MKGETRRRFGLLDAMVLVAATAPALAILRGDDWIILEPAGRPDLSDILLQIRYLFQQLAYPFGFWSIALLALRLRRPRPAFRRLVRQPGMVACTVVAVVAGVRSTNVLLVALVLKIDSSRTAFWEQILEVGYGDGFFTIPSEIGTAIVAAWAIQALGGRWRPEPSWIDRLGRGFAAFWIAAIPFEYMIYLFKG